MRGSYRRRIEDEVLGLGGTFGFENGTGLEATPAQSRSNHFDYSSATDFDDSRHWPSEVAAGIPSSRHRKYPERRELAIASRRQ